MKWYLKNTAFRGPSIPDLYHRSVEVVVSKSSPKDESWPWELLTGLCVCDSLFCDFYLCISWREFLHPCVCVPQPLVCSTNLPLLLYVHTHLRTHFSHEARGSTTQCWHTCLRHSGLKDIITQPSCSPEPSQPCSLLSQNMNEHNSLKNCGDGVNDH